jgi:hypothetical protein
MGTSAAETVREIEETRDRLDGEIRELEERLPKPAVWTKRLIGAAAGGGAGAALFWFGVRRIRKRKKAKAQVQQPVQAIIQVLPDKWSEKVSDALESGQWKGWAAAVGGAWALFKLAEIRQMRRINRALLAGARQ